MMSSFSDYVENVIDIFMEDFSVYSDFFMHVWLILLLFLKDSGNKFGFKLGNMSVYG